MKLLQKVLFAKTCTLKMSFPVFAKQDRVKNFFYFQYSRDKSLSQLYIFDQNDAQSSNMILLI